MFNLQQAVGGGRGLRALRVAVEESGEKGRHLMDDEKRKKLVPAEPTPPEGGEPEPKDEPKPEGDLDS